MSQEIYEATKRKYAEMFAVVEGYRHSLKQIGAGLDPADIEAIETEVRERVRKKRLKDQASGEAWTIEHLEKKGKG
jgi:hypothetical protein